MIRQFNKIQLNKTQLNKKSLRPSNNPTIGSQGFTLIEVLVASLVLAGGIATFLVLQIQSLNHTRMAGIQTQANLLLSDIVDSARANLSATELGAYDRDQASAKDLVTTQITCAPCTPAQIAQQDVNRWVGQVAEQIPDSEITLRYTAPEFHAIIAWPAPEDELGSVTLSTRLCTIETSALGESRCFR